jgi:hypothetical protein
LPKTYANFAAGEYATKTLTWLRDFAKAAKGAVFRRLSAFSMHLLKKHYAHR